MLDPETPVEECIQTGDWRYYAIIVPENTAWLLIDLDSTDGMIVPQVEANLYIRRGVPPSLSKWDYLSENVGLRDQIYIRPEFGAGLAAGPWVVGVYIPLGDFIAFDACYRLNYRVGMAGDVLPELLPPPPGPPGEFIPEPFPMPAPCATLDPGLSGPNPCAIAERISVPARVATEFEATTQFYALDDFAVPYAATWCDHYYATWCFFMPNWEYTDPRIHVRVRAKDGRRDEHLTVSLRKSCSGAADWHPDLFTVIGNAYEGAVLEAQPNGTFDTNPDNDSYILVVDTPRPMDVVVEWFGYEYTTYGVCAPPPAGSPCDVKSAFITDFFDHKLATAYRGEDVADSDRIFPVLDLDGSVGSFRLAPAGRTRVGPYYTASCITFDRPTTVTITAMQNTEDFAHSTSPTSPRLPSELIVSLRSCCSSIADNSELACIYEPTAYTTGVATLVAAIPQAGTYTVLVNSASDRDLQIFAEATDDFPEGIADCNADCTVQLPATPTPTPTPLPNSTNPAAPTVLTGNRVVLSATIGKGETHYYSYTTTLEKGRMKVLMEDAPGSDSDLYIRHGAPATLDMWDARPYSGGYHEKLWITRDTTPVYKTGTWHISVDGYKAGSYRLTIELYPDDTDIPLGFGNAGSATGKNAKNAASATGAAKSLYDYEQVATDSEALEIQVGQYGHGKNTWLPSSIMDSVGAIVPMNADYDEYKARVARGEVPNSDIDHVRVPDDWGVAFPMPPGAPDTSLMSPTYWSQHPLPPIDPLTGAPIDDELIPIRVTAKQDGFLRVYLKNSGAYFRFEDIIGFYAHAARIYGGSGGPEATLVDRTRSPLFSYATLLYQAPVLAGQIIDLDTYLEGLDTHFYSDEVECWSPTNPAYWGTSEENGLRDHFEIFAMLFSDPFGMSYDPFGEGCTHEPPVAMIGYDRAPVSVINVDLTIDSDNDFHITSDDEQIEEIPAVLPEGAAQEFGMTVNPGPEWQLIGRWNLDTGPHVYHNMGEWECWFELEYGQAAGVSLAIYSYEEGWVDIMHPHLSRSRGFNPRATAGVLFLRTEDSGPIRLILNAQNPAPSLETVVAKATSGAAKEGEAPPEPAETHLGVRIRDLSDLYSSPLDLDIDADNTSTDLSVSSAMSEDFPAGSPAEEIAEQEPETLSKVFETTYRDVDGDGISDYADILGIPGRKFIPIQLRAKKAIFLDSNDTKLQFHYKESDPFDSQVLVPDSELPGIARIWKRDAQFNRVDDFVESGEEYLLEDFEENRTSIGDEYIWTLYLEAVKPVSVARGLKIEVLAFLNDGKDWFYNRIEATPVKMEVDVYDPRNPFNRVAQDNPFLDRPLSLDDVLANNKLVLFQSDDHVSEFTLSKYPDNLSLVDVQVIGRDGDTFKRFHETSVKLGPLGFDDPAFWSPTESPDFQVKYGIDLNGDEALAENELAGEYGVHCVSLSEYDDYQAELSRLLVVLAAINPRTTLGMTLINRFALGSWADESLSPRTHEPSASGYAYMPNHVLDRGLSSTIDLLTHPFGAKQFHEQPPRISQGARYPNGDVTLRHYHWDGTSAGSDEFLTNDRFVRWILCGISQANIYEEVRNTTTFPAHIDVTLKLSGQPPAKLNLTAASLGMAYVREMRVRLTVHYDLGRYVVTSIHADGEIWDIWDYNYFLQDYSNILGAVSVVAAGVQSRNESGLFPESEVSYLTFDIGVAGIGSLVDFSAYQPLDLQPSGFPGIDCQMTNGERE